MCLRALGTNCVALTMKQNILLSLPSPPLGGWGGKREICKKKIYFFFAKEIMSSVFKTEDGGKLKVSEADIK